jgi:leader peptidase (prepilin peptidase) / N-methyltransferase
MKELAPFVLLAAGLFGAVLGSFLNVVIYRLPRENLSILRPRRSFCPGCGHVLRWFENIPVFSFLLQGARCRSCRAAIPLRYPLVESLTLLFFVALTFNEIDGFVAGGPESGQRFCVFLVHLALLSAVVVVTFIDLDFEIIPDSINYGGMAAAVILSPLLPLIHEDDSLFVLLEPSLPAWSASLLAALAGGAVGAGTLYLVGVLGKLLFRKDAMGLGDVKFMAFAGGFFGWGGSLTIFLIACVAGSVVGIGYRVLTGKERIPFGPFLSFGMVVLLFFRSDVDTFIFRTWPEWIRSFSG